MQFCLEKAAGPLLCMSTHSALASLFSCRFSVALFGLKLLSSGQPFVPAMEQSSPSVPAPNRASADRPPAWLLPLSLTPEERPDLRSVTTGPRRNSRSSTPTQIVDALVSLAVRKRPQYTI